MAQRESHPFFIEHHAKAVVAIKPEPVTWDRGIEAYPPVLWPMLQWLRDPARAGKFDFRCDLGRREATIAIVKVEVEYVTAARFFFTDPHTAFEFKMRWG